MIRTPRPTRLRSVQVVIPMGGTIDTGHYTEICGGDGVGPAKEWDISPDRVTD